MKPLVEIISHPATADIPFSGLGISTTAASEIEPVTIALADNSVLVAHISGDDIKFIYTDPAGELFTPVTITVGATLFGLACCQLTNGNILLSYFVSLSGNYRLKYRIVTPTGGAVADGEIGFWATSITTSHVWLLTLAANSYLMVYAKDDAIYKRTSVNGSTWSAESDLELTGLTGRLDSPSLALLNTGELWLWFDHVDAVSGDQELRNIYYSISSDSGATWSAPVMHTNYDSYSSIGKHPVALQRTENNQMLLFTNEATLLTTSLGNGVGPVAIAHNPLTGYVNILQNDDSITVWDAVNWEVVTVYNTGSVPAVDTNITYPSMNIGANLVPIPGNYCVFVDLLDVAGDTIRQYNFTDQDLRVKNVDYDPNYANLPVIVCVYMDEANQRLWLVIREYGFHLTTIGYLDLTETSNYTFTKIVDAEDINGTDQRLLIVQSEDMVIFSITGFDGGGEPVSRVKIWSISTGATIKDYTPQDLAGFPRNGPSSKLHYENGVIYFGFTYSDFAGETDRRGLCAINITTDVISYHRPTYASIDNYSFNVIVSGRSGQLLLSTSIEGAVAVFDINSDTWDLYDGTSVPGLDQPAYGSTASCVAYDPTTDLIFAGGQSYVPGVYGSLYMFPYDGTLRRTLYQLATYVEGEWTFSDSAYLIKNSGEYDAVGVADPNNAYAMYAFWQTASGDIKWAKDGSAVDLSGYLTNDEITIQRSINGDPHKLEFTASAGHLFDTHNSYSALRGVLAKGRRLIARWGFTVDEVDQWTPAGTFFVATANVVYERGVYSTIKISAEDMRSIWADSHIWATDYYNNYPEDIIIDLLGTYAGIDAGDIDLPVFDGRILLEYQWLDTTLEAALTQICERFGYFLKINPDNTVTAGRITNTNPVDHAYSDVSTVIRFEPDDKYSDFTNRVTVVGQEKDYLEVTYPEEMIQQLNGTVGWYGFHQDYNVPYSEDESRTCINPRLKVIESSTSIAFELAGDISESITFIDPNNNYCTVTVEAPDLTPMLVMAIAAIAATWYVQDVVVIPVAGSETGFTVRQGTWQNMVSVWTALMILASVGNFQYEVWATPKGSIRRSVQGSADDSDSQIDSGVIVEKKLEDPMCYSVAECEFVAANELLVARLQRNRIKQAKIADLTDEEGHTITIPHPYTGELLTIFITDLNRRYQKASEAEGEGGIYDEIEGWVL